MVIYLSTLAPYVMIVVAGAVGAWVGYQIGRSER